MTLTRRVFLAIVGLSFFFSFLSFGAQIEGLIGSNGIFPVEPFLDAIGRNLGPERFRRVPTVFWIDASDTTLVGACVAGMVAAAVVIAGRYERLALFVCWALYLSIFGVGRVFLAYQWDILLLEVAVVAMVIAPSDRETHPAAVWLGRFLLFKLMFSSGVVKIISQDPTWANLTALMVHYETQPLPTWVGWYAHQLPAWFQKMSVVGVFFIQLVVPFGLVGPRRVRIVAGSMLIFLQVLILLTGNYCFFNLLAIGLAFLAFDDRFLLRLAPASLAALYRPKPERQPVGVAIAAVSLGLLSAMPLADTSFGYGTVPEAFEEVLDTLRPLRLTSGYGLFASMTTERPEIVIEGSMDGETWRAYELPAKPGRLDRPPPFVAPHQPRVDWQLWFAALGSRQHNPWLYRTMVKIMEGSPQVLDLFEHDPFEGEPPTLIRARLYRYRFTSFEERKRTGHWWKREEAGMYFPAFSLRPPPG